jgi:hypothetical protein
MLRAVRCFRRWRAALGVVALLCASPPGVARAGSDEAPAESAAPGLDQLLKLPTGSEYGVERRGGLSRGEWRARFTELDTALASERQGLAQAEAKLDEAAGSASTWQVAPVPGLQPSPDAPLDYQLRVEIRRRKSEIERLEKKLRQLEIEANLAGVPADWRS